MKFLDLQTAFYRPLWLRVVIVALCLGWAVVEYLHEAPLWAMGFAALGLYCAHQFFVAFAPKDPD